MDEKQIDIVLSACMNAKVIETLRHSSFLMWLYQSPNAE